MARILRVFVVQLQPTNIKDGEHLEVHEQLQLVGSLAHMLDDGKEAFILT